MRYSSDLRKRVLTFIKTGGSKPEASRRFDVSRPTIDKWLKYRIHWRMKNRDPKKILWIRTFILQKDPTRQHCIHDTLRTCRITLNAMEIES